MSHLATLLVAWHTEDMKTSEVKSKIGQQVTYKGRPAYVLSHRPEGWYIDVNGRPTTTPRWGSGAPVLIITHFGYDPPSWPDNLPMQELVDAVASCQPLPWSITRKIDTWNFQVVTPRQLG